MIRGSRMMTSTWHGIKSLSFNDFCWAIDCIAHLGFSLGARSIRGTIGPFRRDGQENEGKNEPRPHIIVLTKGKEKKKGELTLR